MWINWRRVYTATWFRWECLSEAFDIVKRNDSEFFFTIDNNLAIIRIESDTLNIYAEGGIQLRSAGVKNLSWEIAQGMQVLVHIDYDIVEVWSEIYKLQNAHDATVSKILDKLYGGSGSILPALEDLIYFEKTLLTKYVQLLALLK